MTRVAMEHIGWARAHNGRHRFDLADSAVVAPDLAALGLPFRAGLANEGYSLLERLEAALGARLSAPGGRVHVTAGASEANACVYGALLKPGDEVLVESPGYEPHRVVPALFGARVRPFPRPIRAEAAAFAAAIEAQLSPATRMIVISDLHNPSGDAIAASAAAALTALAERHGLWIHCDETFRDASPRPLGTAANHSPRWVATASLTKSYGLGGLRIGWIAGSAAALERCGEAHTALSALPALPSVALALELVPHLDALRARTLALLARNHPVLGQTAPRLAPLVLAGPPSGNTAWAAFAGEGLGDALSAFALERFDLAIAPGRFFGDSRGVRIALGGEPVRFAESLATLERATAAFAAACVPS